MGGQISWLRAPPIIPSELCVHLLMRIMRMSGAVVALMYSLAAVRQILNDGFSRMSGTTLYRWGRWERDWDIKQDRGSRKLSLLSTEQHI